MNRCVSCGADLGNANPRQYCRKTYCDQEPWVDDDSADMPPAPALVHERDQELFTVRDFIMGYLKFKNSADGGSDKELFAKLWRALEDAKAEDGIAKEV